MSLYSDFDGVSFGYPNPITSVFIRASTLFEASSSDLGEFKTDFVFATHDTELFGVFTVSIKVGISVEFGVTIFSFVSSRLFRVTFIGVSLFHGGHGFFGHFDSNALNISCVGSLFFFQVG